MTDRQLAEAYQYCPHCGAANPAPGTAPFRCLHCEHTVFFGPVAAVGGIVTRDDGNALFLRRARDPGKGKWGLPGGFIDQGETVEHALAREVKEETGLEVSSSVYLTSFPNEYAYRGYIASVIDVFYICQVSDPSNIVLEEAELDQFQWCEPDEALLANLAFESNRRAIQCWLSSR